MKQSFKWIEQLKEYRWFHISKTKPKLSKALEICHDNEMSKPSDTGFKWSLQKYTIDIFSDDDIVDIGFV